MSSLAPPPSRRKRVAIFPEDAFRNMGIHFCGGKGCGKSRVMGRGLAWRDFYARGIGTVIFDPQGGTIDNFLDKLLRLAPEEKRRIAAKVLYFDMSGSSGLVAGWPLLYQLQGDTLYGVAERFFDVIRRLDPDLTRAAVQGWNSLHNVGTATGMVLHALGLQLTEAQLLLSQPERWAPVLRRLAEEQPAVRPATEFFLDEFSQLRDHDRASQIGTLRSKLAPFQRDTILRSMFGASQPTVDWERVTKEGWAVLLDFRAEASDQIRFKLRWAFSSLLEYIKKRDQARKFPLSLIIDEVSFLLSLGGGGSDVLTQDFDDLINRLARFKNVWLTLAHQEMHQLPLGIQHTLMTMGTQIFGVVTDQATAESLARRFYPYDPHQVKKYEPIYASGMVIDHRSVEFSADDQIRLNSKRFTRLQAFHFLASFSSGEGTVGTTLSSVNVTGLDPGQYPNETLLAQARDLLGRKSGQPIEQVTASIDARVREFKARLVEEGSADNVARTTSQPTGAFTPPPRFSKVRKGRSAAEALPDP